MAQWNFKNLIPFFKFFINIYIYFHLQEKVCRKLSPLAARLQGGSVVSMVTMGSLRRQAPEEQDMLIQNLFQSLRIVFYFVAIE